MSIDMDIAWQQGGLPELTLSGTALAQAGFTAGALFRISLYRNGLMLTRLDNDTDIAALVAELDGNETEGADWVSDNGELTLAGDWLTQSGLLTPPFSIEALPGRIMIRAEPDVMLA
ncbi:SymE family type I addiction module toxin [Dickeya oryzae]|uniref:SymE family type I addiction module toxin n=1 Tax=Dickeya oryzae TaxID=1240404 RepID=UPI00315FCC28